MNNLQDYLDASQYEAVTYNEGPSLILAGAGSGKTRVLTYKIAYLLQQGVQPWQILALTFTNKAAKEMNSRISHLVDKDAAKYLWSGTFHSIFGRILRMEAQHIGYTSTFTIYDQSDAQALISAIVKEMNLDSKVYKASAIHSRISSAKNRLIMPEHYLADADFKRADVLAGIPAVGEIYMRYKNRCRNANAMDFDDLLVETYLLFKSNDAVRLHYLDRFKYILVDEYQDTNYVQHQIISQLTLPDSCISVVGDDAQSIYGFRGARIENILNFTNQYPTARTIKLECNYRSTGNIVDAANAIISHNRNQIPKQVYSKKGLGDSLKLLPASSDKDEGFRIAGEISRLHRQKEVSYADIAVLYRTNAQSRSFEDAFRMQGIPYRIYGGLSFYQRKEVKDLLSYLRLIANPNDEEAFKRIINYPRRGIGDTTIAKLQTAAVAHDKSPFLVAENPETYGLKFSTATARRLDAFCSNINHYASLVAQGISVHELAKRIVFEEGIHKDLEDDDCQGAAKIQNIEELIGAMAEMEADYLEEHGVEHLTLADYLSNVSLLTDADQRDDEQPRVALMTVHAAKGLEFEAVFVTGLEEGLFPAESARFSVKELEEERRLFYVAVTRAKSRCFLSYAKTRFKWGQFQYCTESSFLNDIPKPLFSSHPQSPSLQSTSRADASSARSASQPPARFAPSLKPLQASLQKLTSHPQSSTLEELRVDDRVEHNRFGIGTILSLEGTGPSAKAVVYFQGVGQKTLLLGFAKLKKVNK